MEKDPKVPVLGNCADCGVLVHGEEGPLIPALTGPVAVRLRDAKGDVYSFLVVL